MAGQQTSEPSDPDRSANLWEPVPGDHGAQGAFDESRSRDPLVWVSMHRPTLTVGGLVVGAGWLATRFARRAFP